MKKYFYLIAALCLFYNCKPVSFSVNADSSLEYAIVFEPGLKNHAFLIELRMTGEGDGTTELNLPYEWGPAQGLDQYIEVLEVQNASIEKQTAEYIRLKHGPLEPIKVKYHLSSNPVYPIENPDMAYHPIIQDEHFQIYGNSLFVYPNDLNNKERSVKINWENFPEDWVIHNSYGSNQRNQSFRWRDTLWLESIFVGGDYRVHRIEVEQDPIYVAMRGEWSFSDGDYIELLKKVITQQRYFWNDYDFDYFTVTLAPFQEDKDYISYQGSGLRNSFALNATPKADLNNFKYLFSHELMHEWIGLQIKTADPEGERFWFSEGFTDYFTFINMRECGLLDEKGYVESMNEIIKNHYNSSVREAPNMEIAERFFSDYDNYGKLAYHRGCIFAMFVDWKIREDSKRKSSLKNAMQDFLKICKSGKQHLTDELFLTTINKYVEEPINPFFEKYIQKGELIKLEDWMLGKKTLVENKSTPIFDIGFDEAASIEAKKIVGLKKDSKAFEAGIRNGQLMKGTSYYRGRTDIEATIYVEIDGEDKEVTYMPLGFSKKKIPQFVIQE